VPASVRVNLRQASAVIDGVPWDNLLGYGLKSCGYADRMKTTETSTCRYCGKTITRVVPTPFAVIAEGAKPTAWAGEDGGQFCTDQGGARVAHEPEHPVRL
jgi:hypothetical protein